MLQEDLTESFTVLVNRELAGQISEEERAFLHSNEEMLTQWEQTLRILEIEQLARISDYKQVLKIQKAHIHSLPPEEEKEALFIWRKEQEKWRKKKLLRLSQRLTLIRLRRMQVLPLIEASKKERIQQRTQEKREQKELNRKKMEEDRQRAEERRKRSRPPTPSSYATAYRRGFLKGIGFLYALLRDGLSAENAYELCADYGHTELEIWRDMYEPGLPPPAFPALQEKMEEETDDHF